MIKLSIITTLYKSEKYVCKCLDSILNQDIPLSDYEIIVVNDGSPDTSYDIVLSYAQQYKNIISHQSLPHNFTPGDEEIQEIREIKGINEVRKSYEEIKKIAIKHFDDFNEFEYTTA